ncbi:hypothetical protein LPV64_10860, partial [Ralstonia pseudosolanacearum]|nr:hypothetical protein [Ralstonia pseudosolanacearum]
MTFGWFGIRWDAAGCAPQAAGRAAGARCTGGTARDCTECTLPPPEKSVRNSGEKCVPVRY